MDRQYINPEHAHDIVSKDPYGTNMRVYGVLDGGKYKGQTIRVKNLAEIDLCSSLWLVGTEEAFANLMSKA